MRSDQDVVPAEMLDDLFGRMVDIHQHKIRLGVDRLERSGVVMISLVDHDLRCSRKLANKDSRSRRSVMEAVGLFGLQM